MKLYNNVKNLGKEKNWLGPAWSWWNEYIYNHRLIVDFMVKLKKLYEKWK